jgi:hypothetical protein
LTRSASETVSLYLESLDKQAKRRYKAYERTLNISKRIRIQFGDAAWALYSVEGTIPDGLILDGDELIRK